MKRRAFMALIGGAASAPFLRPLPIGAQQGRLARIGIIDNSPLWDNFRQGLREYGYVEGRTVAFEYREARGDLDRLAAAAASLTRLPVDLIATYGTPMSRAAKRATTRIPIVMIGIGDPVGAGLVASLGRPGGNITGNTVLSPDLSGKRLQLFKEAVGATRVAFLYNPDNASHTALLDELKAAAPPLGMLLIAVPARTFDEFEPRVRCHDAPAPARVPDDRRCAAPKPCRLDRRLFGEEPAARNVPSARKRDCRRAHVLRRRPARLVSPRRELRA